MSDVTVISLDQATDVSTSVVSVVELISVDATHPECIAVHVSTPGIQGIQGPSGDKGDKGDPGDGASTFEHIQAAADSTWTVNHNLGFRPSVTVLSTGGLEMLAEVLHTSLNQALVYFDTPMAGVAVCS